MPGKNSGRATEALLLFEKRMEVQAQAFDQGDTRADAKSMRAVELEIVGFDIPNEGVAAVEADVIVDRVAEGNSRPNGDNVPVDVSKDPRSTDT
jgi:hypothetical protein